ncbi:MAG: PEP-CTERM system histidine kinase PrsK, partial [Gammaproteobacteria bacterium]|nr:PEP-CTERM system histidine kinase PrsK [Gammaproteobacteria bacterium]
MQNIFGAIGYASSAIAFAILFILLLTSWRGRLQGMLLVLAVSITVIWAAVSSWLAYSGTGQQILYSIYDFLEVARNTAWFAFILKLLYPVMHTEEEQRLKVRYAVPFIYTGCIIFALLPFVQNSLFSGIIKLDINIFGHITLSIIGLVLIEQLFRNTRTDERWSIKFMCLGIGGLFAYDLFLYSNALLFKTIDIELWETRGFINALVVPLIAVSAARNPLWSLNVFVSRRIMLHTTALLGTGLYLMVMALGGYYIKDFGGSWGGAAQIIFLFGAAVLLFLLMFSGSMRAWLKVFLNKHFYNYKYDYRDEWMRFTKTLSAVRTDNQFRERAIEAMAEIIDSPGGVLWLRNEAGNFKMVTHWNMSDHIDDVEYSNSSFINFLQRTQWIIDLDEYCNDQELYDDLKLPEWLSQLDQAWLIVPLMQLDTLEGFIVLARPRTARNFNWEDSDLLKAASRQAASYLILLDTTENLVDARQFEAFNRLSAYVVHDIKNVTAQLGLVVKNAERHIGNPEFMKDAISTVQNSVNKMNRLLSHLKKENKNAQGDDKAIELVEVLSKVTDNASVRNPRPEIMFEKHGIHIVANRDRFSSVLSHIIQNAQE